MSIVPKEIANFLNDLGFEKCNLNNISFNYYRHRIYKGLTIQRNRMLLDSPLYKEKINIEIEWNKKSLLETYSECVELHGLYKGKNTVRYELIEALGINDLINNKIDNKGE